MKALLTPVLLLLFFVFSSQIFAQEDMSKLKEMLQEMNDKLAKAELAKDYETILSFYADDAVSLPSYSPMMQGKDAIEESINKSKEAGYKFTDFKLTTLEVHTSGDLVYEVGKYNMTMEMKGMNKPFKDEGKYLTIYQKQEDGSLKIKADMWNTDTNPWAHMKKMEEEDEEE